MTIANSVFAKASVAFVALATAFVLAAPAQAQMSESEMTAEIDRLTALIEQLTSSLGGGSTGGGTMTASAVCPYTWTRTLNTGSTGADVMKLQQFLNSTEDTRVSVSGAGSVGAETEYYGPATGAAVAKFQTKFRTEILSPLGLVNATTFFGPSTMAKANSLCVSTPVVPPVVDDTTDDTSDDDDDTSSDVLEGGEASLEDFDLRSGEDTNLREAQKDAPVAEIEFDVEDGDIQISRIDLVFDATSATEQDPWDTFRTVSLWVDGDMIAEMDVDSRSDWSRNTPTTGKDRIRFTGLDPIFREGETANIVVAVTVQNTVRGVDTTTAQWTVAVDDNGVRGRDGAGLDQYVGDVSDTVSFDIEEEGFDDEVRVNEASNDPTATTFELFDNKRSAWEQVMVFDLDTRDSDNDIEILGLQLDMTFSTGSAMYSTFVDDIRLKVDGTTYDDFTASTTVDEVVFTFDDEFFIDAGESASVEVEVRFKQLVAGNEGVTLVVDVDSANLNAEGANSITGSDLSGSAQSETHTLRTEGVGLEMTDSSATSKNNDTNVGDSYGEYRITFEATAIGDTMWIPLTATRNASTTVGATYQMEDGNGAVVTSAGTTTESLTRKSGGSVNGNFVKINEGQTAVFELVVTFDPTTTGQYRAQLLGAGFKPVTSGDPTDGSTALPAEDFETGNTLINS